MERNLAMDLVRVTEAAALASARHMGRGDDVAADTAAVEAMRQAFDAIAIDGTVVIGEGPEDAIPMLYVGERVGTGQGPQVDVALDAHRGRDELRHRRVQRALGDRDRRPGHAAARARHLHGEDRVRAGGPRRGRPRSQPDATTCARSPRRRACTSRT